MQGSNEGHDDSDNEVNIVAKISDYSTRETGIDRTSCIFCVGIHRLFPDPGENGVLVWKLQEEDEKAKPGVDNQATKTDTMSENIIIFIIEVDTRRGLMMTGVHPRNVTSDFGVVRQEKEVGTPR